MAFEIVRYTDAWEEKWDRFVMQSAFNGTFLQTRHFLNYHPQGRFTDASLLFLQGSQIAAVIPACEVSENGKRCFYSHKGSTFGGFVIDKAKYNISSLETLFETFEKYIIQEGYHEAFIKNTSDVFSEGSNELLDYYFYKNGYTVIDELSFYIDCSRTGDDILSSWSSGRRRDYKYALKNDLLFRRLEGDDELASFYDILVSNLARHNARPVHTLDELREFRDSRLQDIVDFFGVFHHGELIAGTMLFYFRKNVLHTQYLAQKAEYASLFTMNYLNYNLIRLAKEKGFSKFSFGISTEERGKILNTGLAVFKEGFGTQFCNNRSYDKQFVLPCSGSC